MSDPVDDLITGIIRLEGGFCDHPADRGGATNFGITIGTLRDWRRKPVGVEDVRSLTEEEARLIYRGLYFTAGGFEHVTDASVQAFLFDWAVNSGVATASKGLQSAIGAVPDGVIGPATVAALARVTDQRGLFYQLKIARLDFLLRVVGRDPSQSVFCVGWANRVAEFHYN